MNRSGRRGRRRTVPKAVLSCARRLHIRLAVTGNNPYSGAVTGPEVICFYRCGRFLAVDGELHSRVIRTLRSLAVTGEPVRDPKQGQGAKGRPHSKIRRADPGDADTVRRISADAYVPAYMAVLGTIPKPATEDYRPRIERGEVWILEVQDEPVGIAVFEVNTDHLLMYSIAVKPHLQRKGHGKALLNFADNLAIERGLDEIRIYTNERMERNLTLYKRHGFVEVGKRPHPSRPGQVLVDLVRKLPRLT